MNKILKLPKAFCKYGASMGRRDNIPNPEEKVKLHLRKLEWYDGDYDSGGTYWGYTTGTNIFWAYGDSKEEQINIFVRANNRNSAKELVNKEMPNAKFYR